MTVRGLLVTSSGFDMIFELSLEDENFGDILWEWHGWDYGDEGLRFDTSKVFNTFYTRDERYKGIPFLPNGETKVVYVDNPLEYNGYGIPAKLRATNINDAAYGKDGKILATLFHRGAVIEIDRKKLDSKGRPSVKIVLEGLEQPHGINVNPSGYHVTSTGDARFLILDDDYRPVRQVKLEGMLVTGSRAHFPKGLEWLQYTTRIKDDIYAMVDIHRKKLHIVDTKRKKYRSIELPPEWSVQNVLPVPSYVEIYPGIFDEVPIKKPEVHLSHEILELVDEIAGNDVVLVNDLINLLAKQEKKSAASIVSWT